MVVEINQTQASNQIMRTTRINLGPTLFTLYVNDSPDFITARELYMLADNTAAIFAVTNNTDAMNKTMQVYQFQTKS